MKILYVASEAVPFCKTGGLADVMGALPRVMAELGHEVRMVLPLYRAIDRQRYRLLPLMPEMLVNYAGHTYSGSVLRCNYPRTNMPVYFIDAPDFFDREGLYGNEHGDYLDNPIRFSFFNMATIWMLKGLDWQPDIVHLNDWQTGLIPALLKHHPVVSADPFYKDVHSVFSIHNLAYQGSYDKFLVPNIGLPWDVYTSEGLEFFNKASFLKSGLAYSDELVAVSPTYAQEIQVDGQGAGMEGTLRKRAANLHGIMNGIDKDVWNPANDQHIASCYTADSPGPKGEYCKAALQAEVGLPKNPNRPLVAMISRLVAAKGLDLIEEAIDKLAALDAQFFFLGNGKPEYEAMLLKAAEEYPDKIGARIAHDEALAHRVIAGADIFLMPSNYEPCGLTQLYSMRYGTIPVVHKTGGLADSVYQATPESIQRGLGLGFAFENYEATAMINALEEALKLYRKDKPTWAKLMHNAMNKDFSWDKSARQYEDLYRHLKGSSSTLK